MPAYIPLLSWTGYGQGFLSGSYTITGYVDDNDTGKITIIWDNYNDGTGATIKGTSTYEVAGVYIHVESEYIEETGFIETYQALSIDYGSYAIIIEAKSEQNSNSRLIVPLLFIILMWRQFTLKLHFPQKA